MTTTTLPTTATGALGLGSTGLAFGCDYNPEQWDPEVWVEDVRLMREAGVNLVAINVFGWSHVEPRQGEYDFAALDTVIELLHGAGIGVDLGTGTASTPPWLTTRYPEVLPVVADGTTRWPGGRQAFCPSSPIYREHALALVRATAERYGDHPAVRLWHVSNELGCHNAHCYCDVSAQAFRGWLQARYGTVDALNAAWGTSFWSQRYSAWEQVLPPRATLSFTNPAQTIDFDRFSSDELLGHHRAEAAVLRELSDKPVTTNFMVAAHITALDYWSWAGDMDVIANDHYLDHRLPRPHVELAFAADTTRGLAGGAPGCSWSTRRVPSTGSRTTSRRPRARCSGTPRRTSPAAPTGSASSSGARPCRAARSSTPHCCRTPAPSRGRGATWSRSAPWSSGSASCAAHAWSPTWRSCSAGRTSGRPTWRPTPAPRSATWSRSTPSTPRSGTSA